MTGSPCSAARHPVPGQDPPGLKLFTTYLFLNTRQPPFTSLKARQALNYAIDRGRIGQLLGFGPPEAAPGNCSDPARRFPQLPALLPLHGLPERRLAPPRPGHGNARLAHQSGTTHVPVTVWNFWGQPVGAYLVQLFRQLGYQATLCNVTADQFFAAAGTPAARSRQAWRLGSRLSHRIELLRPGPDLPLL